MKQISICTNKNSINTSHRHRHTSVNTTYELIHPIKRKLNLSGIAIILTSQSAHACQHDGDQQFDFKATGPDSSVITPGHNQSRTLSLIHTRFLGSISIRTITLISCSNLHIDINCDPIMLVTSIVILRFNCNQYAKRRNLELTPSPK